uniref:CSON005200 protein n=1 Tax=Culicoides sonorensis TaxID=179676 RepID=A0A336MSE0_CULSO
MNSQLIRHSFVIFQSSKFSLCSHIFKLSPNLGENVRKLHTSNILSNPRFTKSITEHENEVPVSKSMTGSGSIQINQQNRAKSHTKPASSEEDQNWDEVEAEMFHGRKPKGVEIPKMTFKGKKSYLKKGKVFDMDEIDRKSQTQSQISSGKFSKPKTQPPIKKVIEPEEIYDTDIGKYLKLERDDPILDKLLLKIQSKKEQERRLVLEGRRLIQEGLEAGLKLHTLIFSKIEQVKAIKDEILQSKAKLYKVANHNLKLWSQLTTTPGILGIFDHPENLNELIENKRSKQLSIPVSIVCDNIREPNNLGAIIRVAAAAGADQVILTKGCTNPWDLKCIRGSSGTHFRVKIVGPIEWMELENHLPISFEYFIADNKSKEGNLPVFDYDALEFEKKTHKVLVIGGEAHGISRDAELVLENALKRNPRNGAVIRIPLAQEVNSLNVASALSVVLFEMRRKLKK